MTWTCLPQAILYPAFISNKQSRQNSFSPLIQASMHGLPEGGNRKKKLLLVSFTKLSLLSGYQTTTDRSFSVNNFQLSLQLVCPLSLELVRVFCLRKFVDCRHAKFKSVLNPLFKPIKSSQSLLKL